MLTYFSIKNYRSFGHEFWLELRTSMGNQWQYLSKILITGQNGVGKTNLCRAIMDIRNTFMEKVPYWDDCEDFLNADSNADTASFHYGFKFKHDYIDYSYEKTSQDTMAKEEMRLNNRFVYSVDFRAGTLCVDQTQMYYIGAGSIDVNKYSAISKDAQTGTEKTTPFLRWLTYCATFTYDCILMRMSAFIMKMDFICPASANASRWAMFTKDVENQHQLHGLELFLNEMGIDCELMMKDNEGKKELYIAKTNPIQFFQNASTGTLALCMLYDASILSSTFPSLLIVDELDSGLSEESAEKAAKYLANLYGQVIMTTHSGALVEKGIFEKEIRITQR